MSSTFSSSVSYNDESSLSFIYKQQKEALIKHKRQLANVNHQIASGLVSPHTHYYRMITKQVLFGNQKIVEQIRSLVKNTKYKRL